MFGHLILVYTVHKDKFGITGLTMGHYDLFKWDEIQDKNFRILGVLQVKVFVLDYVMRRKICLDMRLAIVV